MNITDLLDKNISKTEIEEIQKNKNSKPGALIGEGVFPTDAHTQLMSSTPYMEAGIGIDNVFKVLRIDYTWRLTYRNNPQACRGGLRFMFHFTF